MQRLAVVSDIHGNLPALEAVLADAAHHAVDATVNLGDIASGPLWPRETVAMLQTLGLPTIAGNHERQVLADDPATMGASDAFAAERLDDGQRAWLRALPGTLRLGDVHLCHGTPDDDLTMWLESLDAAAPGGVRAASATEVRARSRPALTAGATLVLCGHSHVARVIALDAVTTIVNPGSVGLQAWQDDRVAAIGIEAGSPHARYAIVERSAVGWDVTLRAVTYDWSAAARRAEVGSRREWAHALATGRNPIE